MDTTRIPFGTVPMRNGDRNVARLRDKLRPLHRRLPRAPAGGWLDVHPERGQSFEDYVGSDPNIPLDGRNVIRIQPLGPLSRAQRRVMEQAAECIGLYFGIAVEMDDALPLSLIPAGARRKHPRCGGEQILTTYVLERLLAPRMPGDAVAYIAFTACDLWPGPGWNFVFGQASLRDRVGVWSLCRNGEPDGGEEGFRLCLLRTIKTGTHELGHMFGIAHCVDYRCNMNRSNSRQEADRRPVALCPDDLAKLAWAAGFDPLQRFRALAGFFHKQPMWRQARFYARCVDTLTAAGT